VFADLYLRVDLPGAAWLAHQAFRAVVAPLEWLTDGGDQRLKGALAAWAVCLPLAWRWPRFGRVFWGGTALVVGLAQVLIVALAALMERALAAGLAVAVVTALLTGTLGWDGGGAGPRRSWAWGVAAVVAAAGAVACYYVFALFMTYGEGYAVLRWAGDLVRQRGVQLLPLYAVAVAALQFAALVALARLPGQRRQRVRGLSMAAAAGLVVAVVLEIVLGQRAAIWPFFLVIPAGAMIASLLWPLLVRRPTRGGWRLRAIPQVLLLPCVLAVVLMGHTYAARVFRCDGLDAVPGLTLVATPAEVFRVTLARDATVAGLTLRTSMRLATLTTHPQVGDLALTHVGAASLDDSGDPDGETTLNGVPEELVYAPSVDRFYATLSPHRYDRLELTESVEYGDGGELTNVLLTITGDGARVVGVVGVPGLCWINTLRWSDTEDLLYIGCEDRAGVHRYDPVSRTFQDGNRSREIGDVQKIALAPSRSRLYTVSLWKRATLTELSQETLDPLRQVVIGGSHYDVVHDPRSERLFASAYYGSRVHVVHAETFQRERSIPAGFGTRALALADDLLLVSSVHDGLLRVCEPDSGRVRHSLRVGGHVKDIAIDPERDQAWFWSQCGLMRLDLAELRASE